MRTTYFFCGEGEDNAFLLVEQDHDHSNGEVIIRTGEHGALLTWEEVTDLWRGLGGLLRANGQIA